eukprot:TRINITY_DN10209_c0_g2_i1.p1 TRINITY_DN10209_c0_g2~~TRINITY_DN10209_c0_g2_i1.p1  ORF type:complete len:429 (-),score=81.28 TRINITY_DN10209_c0_g2_i1:275-1561(-)
MKTQLQSSQRPEKGGAPIGKKSSRIAKPYLPNTVQFLSTLYGSHSNFRDSHKVAANQQECYGGYRDKIHLPAIAPRRQREPQAYIQQFEGTGVTGVQRRQHMAVKVVEGRANERLRMVKNGCKAACAGDKRKMLKRNKAVKRTINKPKGCEPVSSLIEVDKPAAHPAKECKSYNDIQQFKLELIVAKKQEVAVEDDDIVDINEILPKDVFPFEDDKLELQKLKEADGLRHFMWPITPVNIEEEEENFFKSGCKINPIFAYQKPKVAARYLKLFKKPDGSVLPLAVKIIEAFLTTYGSESKFLSTDGGEVLSLSETKQVFQNYIDGLELGQYLKLDFSYNTVSPTTISHIPKSNQSIITIGLPVEYRKNRIEGVLNHEVGTHFLRNYNDKLQYWHKSRKKNHLRNYLAIEEGLASLNQLFHIVTPLFLL